MRRKSGFRNFNKFKFEIGSKVDDLTITWRWRDWDENCYDVAKIITDRDVVSHDWLWTSTLTEQELIDLDELCYDH